MLSRGIGLDHSALDESCLASILTGFATCILKGYEGAKLLTLVESEWPIYYSKVHGAIDRRGQLGCGNLDTLEYLDHFLWRGTFDRFPLEDNSYSRQTIQLTTPATMAGVRTRHELSRAVFFHTHTEIGL